MKNNNIVTNKPAEKKAALWSRDFVIVMCASSGIAFCNHFFTPTLPIYAHNLTGSDIYGGILMAAFTVAALATRFAGGLVDRIGRVKLLVFGAAICAVACFLYNFSAAVIVLVLVRALHGVGFGFHSTSSGAAAGDIIPKSRMSEGLGIYGLYATVASAVGPAIALTVIGDGRLEDFRPLFIIAAIIAVVCVVLDSLIRYERKKQATAKAGPVEPQRCDGAPLPKTLLGFEYGVFLPAAVIILVFIASSSLMSYLTRFAQVRGMGNIGLYFTLSSTGMFLSRVFLGKVADRKGGDAVIIPGLIALVVLFSLIPFVHSAVYLYLLAVPMGMASGAVAPAVNSMIFARCSAERRGTAAAAYFASIDTGIAIGSIIFGVVADRLGFLAVYWGASLFVLAALVVYLLKLRQKKPRVSKAA